MQYLVQLIAKTAIDISFSKLQCFYDFHLFDSKRYVIACYSIRLRLRLFGPSQKSALTGGADYIKQYRDQGRNLGDT